MRIEVIAGDVWVWSTFFVREILDGIGAKPGGDYIH